MAKYKAGYEGLKVLGARAVVKLEEAENTTASGIIIATTEKDPKFEGEVVATGEGQRLENGTYFPMEIAPGDRVIYSRMAGVPVSYKGENLLVINERDVIAVIE